MYEFSTSPTYYCGVCTWDLGWLWWWCQCGNILVNTISKVVWTAKHTSTEVRREGFTIYPMAALGRNSGAIAYFRRRWGFKALLGVTITDASTEINVKCCFLIYAAFLKFTKWLRHRVAFTSNGATACPGRRGASTSTIRTVHQDIRHWCSICDGWEDRFKFFN